MTTLYLFFLTLCAIIATFALINISSELKATRSTIEDLTSGLDELNSNAREQSATKRFNEPEN